MNAQAAESLWIYDPRQLAEDATFLQGWRECAARGSFGSIYLQPDVFLATAQDRRPLVYLRPAGDGTPGGFDCLAAFKPKALHLARKAVLPWLFSLQGVYLVGNQLLGNSEPVAASSFLEDLLLWLNSRQSKVQFVYFDDLETGSPLWNALDAARLAGRAPISYPFPAQPHWWIEFPDPPADYWKRLSGKTWADIRSAARKLKHSVRTFTAAEQVAEFLDKAHRISKESWQAQRLGLRVRNSPQEKLFHESLALQGAFRCYVLEHDDQPLAFELGNQWNGCFTFEETGFIQSSSHLSPGKVLLLRVIEDLAARDAPSLCDFGTGDAPYKQFYGTRQTTSGPVLLVRRALRPRFTFMLQNLARSLASGARAGLKKVHLHSYLRRRYREGAKQGTAPPASRNESTGAKRPGRDA
jgi:hypothetical protein